MIPFAGWEMPVQYSGIVPEHQAVRQAVGVFDISHMGQFIVSGTDAASFLNRALSNDVSKLKIGQGQYSLLLNGQGGVIDDLILYRTTEKEFFLVVNASRISADWKQLQSLLTPADKVQMANASAVTGGIAVQGPKSRELFRLIMGEEAIFPEHNTIFIATSEQGILWLCGTGYTGEEGFELFTPSASISDWFTRSLSAAESLGGKACGLGARDTLRLEMGYPLNGNDLAEDKTALQAGLGFFVSMDKGDFCGRDALVAQKASSLPSKLSAFRMLGTCPPPRPHYPVLWQGAAVAEITSGTQSPSLGYGIGMAYLPLEASKLGTALEIDIRGKRYAAEVVKKPFFQRSKA
jgi:aminomethyltransferase